MHKKTEGKFNDDQTRKNNLTVDLVSMASNQNAYHILNFKASVTSYVYEIRPKIRGPFDGC